MKSELIATIPETIVSISREATRILGILSLLCDVFVGLNDRAHS